MSNDLFSLGLAVGTQNKRGEWLEAYFPQPLLKPDPQLAEILCNAVDYNGGNQTISLSTQQLNKMAEGLQGTEHSEHATLVDSMLASEQALVIVILESDEQATSVPEAYLKLHLLSHRLLEPHKVNLAGLFGVLPNVAWTNQGAVDLQELPQRQWQARLNGENLAVKSLDKFPQMTDYVTPTGVRIAATSRVRLGAYLGEGTTVMHEGFVNFNAGTAGPGMIEGRISAGVFVGEGSDLGGGCSTMGTLSGGNEVIISVGKECLIGANAGVGIPLGDRCTIEAGLYLTGGARVSLLDNAGKQVETIKARELSGKSDLLFRRHSLTGTIECLTNKSAIALNEELHANN